MRRLLSIVHGPPPSGPPGPARGIRAGLCALVYTTLLVSGFAAETRAEVPGPPLERGASAAERAEAWRGRFCTPLSCAPAGASPLAAATGFGLAVLAAARLSRRDRA